MKKNIRVKRQPTYAEALFAILSMVVIIGVGYVGFKIRVEMLMIMSAVVVGLLSRRLGYNWTDLEEAISFKMKQATPVVLIMWSIGIVIATFMFSGTIPYIIHVGLKVVNPKYFYAGSFLLCVIMSVATGTSWGSAGTAGVAMMGVSAGLGLSPAITAASVVCGVIVGDKVSPLSDSTNFAPMCAGTNLYAHIKSMMWTTIPAAIITLSFFLYLGRNISVGSGTPQVALDLMAQLEGIYNIGPILVLPFIVIIISAFLKQPPVPTMLGASAVALIIGALVNGFNIVRGLTAAVNGFNYEMVYSGKLTGDLVRLLNRGGMRGMVGVVIIIYCGYAYISIVNKTGCLETALNPLVSRVGKNQVSLTIANLLTTFFVVACSGSAFPGHLMSAEMYKKSYIDLDLDMTVLSRTLEDAGTILVAIIPWGASGAFYFETLGVPIWGAGGYAPYALNVYLNPLMAVILAITGIGMFKMSKSKKEEELKKWYAERDQAALETSETL